MLTRDPKWTFGDPETLVYIAAVVVGVPLTMWELWNLGRTGIVAALASLWLPTVAALGFDWAMGRISMLSVYLFVGWVVVVIGAGVFHFVA